MPAIEIRNLCKQYGNHVVVDSVSFEVEEGKLVSLLGVNGAGKTTIIKMLSCLTKPTSGDAFLFGHSILNDSYAIKKIINVSPQETAIAPNLTVQENLEFLCGIYGNQKKLSKQKTKEMLEQLKLTKIASQKSQTLSGGWQRRLSIAMALISEPKILFLDEPTLGLDVLARRELWSLIEGLKGKMTIILTTHYLEEAESLSDQIIIMAGGHLLDQGSVSDLKKKTGKDSLEEAFVTLCTKGEIEL